MDMHPEFMKLIDEHAKAAVEKHIKPEPWYSKVFWGVVASLLAAGLIALATLAYSGGSDCHGTSRQADAYDVAHTSVDANAVAVEDERDIT